ncbi:fungal-specific transcription factor domain-containing protein [Mycena latifolia]|nr:fungal-specific transcription factor domain-containing protein [Mycena latifolia]
MSSDEDRQNPVPAKKRRVQRACDMCRLKKRACDGLRMSTKKCTNCIEYGLDCTFAGGVAKRSSSYVDVLAARLELTEQLLRKLSPQSSETIANAPSSNMSQWSAESPILKHKSDTTASAGPSPGPGVELAGLTIRSMNTPAPAPLEDRIEHVALTRDLSRLSINQHRERFLGKSSGANLIKAAVILREGYEEKEVPWASRRLHYWTFNPAVNRRPHVGPYVFPDADLFSVLIDLYFTTTNLYFPLLHRPTFERSVADGLHMRDTSFGAVVLLVCAIASRYSDDPRISEAEEDPLRCGWQYFDQVPHDFNHLFSLPTIYHLQYYCLAVTFLQLSTPTPCWTLIGIGIRLAHDVGAHRARHLGPQTAESELWKRAFWVIVCYDRITSSALGRACTTQYEDFDVELPIECDDKFWDTEVEDPAHAWKQPTGSPSQITCFNCFIRLNNIHAFSLKMLYALNKTKSLLAVRDDTWEEHIAAELDSALNGWVDSIPAHLQWDPNHQDDAFFDQSAFLYCSYYHVQMIIHRPFIPMMQQGQGAAKAPPSLAICINAARSCSHVVDISNHRKNGAPVPVILGPTFMAAIILLLNVWSGKRTGLPPHLNSALTEVHKCMESIRVGEDRWQSKGLFWDLLSELAAIGQLPLPRPTPSAPASEPAPPAVTTNAKKRARNDNAAEHPRAPTAAVVRYPPYADAYAASGPTPFLPGQSPFGALPTYTADLGRLSVFHPYAESSSWYPAQTSSAPLGAPDFAVTNAHPHAGGFEISTTDAAFKSGAGAGQGEGYAPGADNGFAGAEAWEGINGEGMRSDMRAMWANAPTGFEVDEWGTYFSVMSDLYQGVGSPSSV